MRLTRYGLREMLLCSLVFAGVIGVAVWAASALSGWFWIAAVPPAGLWAWVLAFFRDPERSTPSEPGRLVSPADGRVADITELGPDGPLGVDAVQIGVFMSLFDVHVNRAPETGTIEQITHKPGAFLDARDPHASQRNESTTIRMTCEQSGETFRIIVRQVAGLVARRIVTDLREAGQVRRGERIGMIKFGSRLEVIVPRRRVGRVCVEIGRRVRAGETVLIEVGEPTDE